MSKPKIPPLGPEKALVLRGKKGGPWDNKAYRMRKLEAAKEALREALGGTTQTPNQERDYE